jgi:hypothetical protein
MLIIIIKIPIITAKDFFIVLYKLQKDFKLL